MRDEGSGQQAAGSGAGRGSNSGEDLKRRVEGIAALLDQISELQGDVKLLKEEAKGDGYDLKVLMKVVRETRASPKAMAAQLELELVLDTYRSGAGLPVTLEDAQARVMAAAEGALG